MVWHVGHDVILCTGGNHDRSLEQKLLCTDSPFVNAVYLQDEATDYRGIRFYGSPWTPLLPTHAFYGSPKKREHAWRSIPSDTDILITHTPPAGILDKSGAGLDLGCKLLSRELERIKPRIHCFGHVHASRGVFVQNGTTFVNASSVDYRHETPFPPINVDL